MGNYWTARSGLALRVTSGDRVGSGDLNQVADSLLAGKRVILDLLGGEAIYAGGAEVLADITTGTQYPAVTMVVADDSGNLWPFKTTSATAITFNVTSTAAGAARLYAVPALLAGVSPAAADGRYNQLTFVCDDVANAAPAHSLLLGTGTVTASALTAYTAADLTPATAQILAEAAAHAATHADGAADAVTPASIKAVKGPGTVTDGRVAVFDGTTGYLAKQGTRLEADLVAGPASATGDNLASYNGTGGKTIKDSGIATANVAKLDTANTFTANQEISGASPEVKVTETDASSCYGRIYRAGDVLRLSDQQTKTDATAPGYALSLATASSQYANSAADNDMSGNAWSIEAWVYPTSHGLLRGISSKNNTNVGEGIRTGDGWNSGHKGKLSGGIGAQQFVGTTALSLNAWSHIAVTYDGSNIRTYINGALDSTTAYAGGTTWSSQVITAGSDWSPSPSGRAWDGRLDEVAWWNKTLSLAEVQARYNSGVGSRLVGTETNLVYCWHFDENTGTSAANAVSGQPSLTLQSGAAWGSGIVPQPGGSTSTVEVDAVAIKDATVAGNEGRVELGEAASELMLMRLGFTRDAKFGPPTGGYYYTGELSMDAAGAIWYYTGTGWVQHAPGCHGTWTGGGATDITTAANWNGGALLDGYLVIDSANSQLWEYDTTTSEWLGSRANFQFGASGTISATTTVTYLVPSDNLDYFLEEFATFFTAGAGTWDVSNYWTIQLRIVPANLSGASAWSNLVTVSQAGTAASYATASSALMDTSTKPIMYVQATKTGSPGTLTIYQTTALTRLVRK